MVAKGTSCPAFPVESNRSGLALTNTSNPPNTLPSPIAINPKTGINKPPINKPTALIESETATAFKPPKTAYTEPINPIPHIQITRAVLSVTPNNVGTSNMPLMATEPEYNITGSNTTT